MKSTKHLSEIQFVSGKLVKALTFIAVIMLYLLPMNATTYYVSLTGDDENAGTSAGSAWRHIAYGTQQVQAGDTLLILSGDYGDERAEIANSGTAGSPIVIKADIPGEVLMQSSSGGGTGILIEGNSHIVIEGIEFRNFGGGIQVYHVGSYITVRKCVFVENHNNGFTTWGTSSDVSLVHHILVEYCEFYDYANGDTNDNSQDYGIYFCYASHCVAKNNYFFGWHHQALSFKRKVHYGLAKDNVFEGFRYSALYLGQNLDDPNDQRSRYLIAEGNTFSPAEGYRAKTPIWIANVDRAVARNNFIEGHKDSDGGSGQGFAIGDPAYSGDTRDANPDHVNIYNNVIRSMGGNSSNPGIRLMDVCQDVRVFNNTFTECAYGLGFEVEDTILFQNNIFYENQVRMIKEGTGERGIFRYNDIYPSWAGSGATDISVDPLFAGTLDILTLPAANPRFLPDYSRAEVCKLQGTSLCIDAGTHATVTTGSGSGTVIGVEDAGYFTDGFDLSYGDLIQVGGNNPVRITGIDYDNNEITVEQSISWNSADGVNHFYVGSVSDIGAYEYVITGAIAGTVTDNSTSNPIEGVIVSDGTRYDTTDVSGNYTIEDVPVDHIYTVIASISGYDSLLINDVVVTEDNTTTVDFQLIKIPVGTISGTVTYNSTGNPIKGAMVTDGTRSDDTDADGNYSITDVPVGSYTVTASIAEFIPLSIVDVVTENSTLVLDFSLVEIPTGTVSGTVTDSNTDDPIEGVIVSNGVRTDTTDVGGNYTLLNVYADSVYTVTATKSGYLALSVDDVVVTEGNTITVDIELTEASDLVGFWSFEQISGTIAHDSSVNHNDGELSGPISTAGKLDLAFLFDGSDDYITVPKSPSLDAITEALTLIAWVKIPTTERHSILSRWVYGDGDERSFEFDIENGKVWFGLSGDGSGGTFLNSGNKITSNEWTHVAVTSDGTTMKIYMNGILDPNTKGAPSSIHPSAADLRIGRWMSGPDTWHYPFDGAMDEVKIYNRSLSAQEISADFGITEPTGAISGTATDNSTANPIEGAIVTDGSRSDTTDAGGNYTLTDVPVNTYTVITSISGYYPLSIDNVVVTEDNTTTVDFQLAELLFGAISGTVTDDSTGLAIEGVIVTDGTRSDTTNAGGYYILENVPEDSYTVTASVSGYLILSIEDVFATGNDTTIVDFLLTPAADLVGFWPFEETTGTVTADLSMYGNDGELYGPTSTTGIENLAFQFNGSTDYIRVPQSTSLDSINDAITMISWVKMPVGTRQTILERWLMNDYAYILDVDDAGKVNFGLCGDGTSADQVWLTSAGSVTADTWTHVAVTSDGTTMKVYIDNVLDANTIAPPSAIYTAEGNVHIGRWAKMSGFWSNPFNGAMDEVKLYNRALTTQEIADDFVTVGIYNNIVEDGLLQAYPNPFNYLITISYKSPVASKVVMDIYNLTGQKIRTLISETQQADYYSVVWDGTNATGGSAGPGMYFCILHIDNKPVASKKLVLSR